MRGDCSEVGCCRNEDTACWMSMLIRRDGKTREALHIQLGLAVGSQVTERTCGSMLHLHVCLVTGTTARMAMVTTH